MKYKVREMDSLIKNLVTEAIESRQPNFNQVKSKFAEQLSESPINQSKYLPVLEKTFRVIILYYQIFPFSIFSFSKKESVASWRLNFEERDITHENFRSKLANDLSLVNLYRIYLLEVMSQVEILGTPTNLKNLEKIPDVELYEAVLMFFFVTISTIRSSTDGLFAVFISGLSGAGKSTLLTFVNHSRKHHEVIVAGFIVIYNL